MTALVTGATGFIGGRLAATIAERASTVRCLVRDRSRAALLPDRGLEVVQGDVLDPSSLRGAGDGIEVAYYVEPMPFAEALRRSLAETDAAR